MAARDSNVNINLNATNRASGAIEQVRKSLGGLDGAAGMATKGLAGLAGAFGAGMLLQFGSQVAGAVTQMAQLAASSQMVAGSMQGLAASFGQSGDAMLDSLKRASNGTIAEYDLMLGANKAMMLGVATNADQLEGIMKVALARGAAMGLSTTQAFDNLVTGLGRGSALILDNLGITMQSLRAAEETYAASLGKTTEALSDQERKQAMVNAVLKEAESVDLSNVDGMAASFAQAQAAISDMKTSLGELFGPAIAAVATTIRDAAVGAKTIAENLTAADVALPLTQQVGDAAAKVAELRSMWAEMKSALPVAELERVYQLQDQLEAGIGGMEGIPFDYQPQVLMLNELVLAERQLYDSRKELAAQQWNAGEETRIASILAMQNQLNLAQEEAGQKATAAASASAQAWAAATAQIDAMTADWAAKLFPTMGFEAFGVAATTAAKYRTQLDVLTASGYTLEQALVAVEVAANGDLAALTSAGEAAGGAATKTGELRTAAGAAAGEMEQLGGKALAASGGLSAIQAEAINAANALYQLEHAAGQAAAAATASALSSIRSTSLQAAATLGVADAMQTYEDQARTVQQVGGYLAKAGMDQTQVEFELAAMTDRMTGQTMDRVRAIEAEATALNTASGSTGGGGARGYATALNDVAIAGTNVSTSMSGLQGEVQSALSGALDAGVDPAAFLPREDAINENARRLADIMVNGFKDQSWLEEFKAEAPDVYGALMAAQDPQAAAAGMLQQFQDGLLPGLIDKEAVKEKVKRAILGDANMSALAQEITAELAAEMGQDPAALAGTVNQAMGRTAGDTSSGDMQTAVISQLKAANFINAIGGAAGQAGTKWGDGFLAQIAGNVPAALIDLLATLVAPLVREKNQQEDSRSGAN